MEDLLSRVSAIFSDLHQHASSYIPAPEVSVDSYFGDFLTPIPPLKLSRPHSDALVGALTNIGVSSGVAQELSEIHARSCSELAREYEEIYENICFQVSTSCSHGTAKEQSRLFSRLQKICRLYDRTVASWASELVQSVAPRDSQKPVVQTKEAKYTSFNSDYLPVLKAFFQLNSRPSPAEKVFLANRSRMTVKQINIWFQNRRARFKKNKTSKQVTALEQSPLNMTTSLQMNNLGPEETISDAETVQEEETASSSTRSCSRSSSVTLVDEEAYGSAFKMESPDYAFPTKYPPELQEEPFPCVNGDFSFTKPVWRCANTGHHRTIEIRQETMVDLVKAMGRLSLESDEQDRSSSTTQTSARTNWNDGTSSHLTPFITRPPVAPLPSLLRSFVPGAERETHTSLITSNILEQEMSPGHPQVSQPVHLPDLSSTHDTTSLGATSPATSFVPMFSAPSAWRLAKSDKQLDRTSGIPSQDPSHLQLSSAEEHRTSYALNPLLLEPSRSYSPANGTDWRFPACFPSCIDYGAVLPSLSHVF